LPRSRKWLQRHESTLFRLHGNRIFGCS